MPRILPFLPALLLAILPTAGLADTLTALNDDDQVELVLREHVFTPAEIHIKAGRKAEILVKNQDEAAEEFDSSALKTEKVIGGKSEGVVRLRALKPGRYPFIGEFNAKTAQGVVVAE